LIEFDLDLWPCTIFVF